MCPLINRTVFGCKSWSCFLKAETFSSLLFVFVRQTSWRWGRSPSWWHNGAGFPLRASLQSASIIRPLKQQRPLVAGRRHAVNRQLHSGDDRGAETLHRQTSHSGSASSSVRCRLHGNGPCDLSVNRHWPNYVQEEEGNECLFFLVNICCFTHWDALTEGCAFKDRRLLPSDASHSSSFLISFTAFGWRSIVWDLRFYHHKHKASGSESNFILC